MKRSLIALALAAAVPFAASAQVPNSGLSYNYVQGGYVSTNTESGDADGWGLGGSVAVHPNVHLFGNYISQDVNGANANFDQWRVGAGYNTSLTAKVDFVANLAYEKFNLGRGFDFDGYSAEAGVRGALAPKLEGYALLGYEDGGDFEGDVYGRLGALVKFTPSWGVTTDLKLADGDTQWMVGPRLTW